MDGYIDANVQSYIQLDTNFNGDHHAYKHVHGDTDSYPDLPGGIESPALVVGQDALALARSQGRDGICGGGWVDLCDRRL